MAPSATPVAASSRPALKIATTILALGAATLAATRTALAEINPAYLIVPTRFPTEADSYPAVSPGQTSQAGNKVAPSPQDGTTLRARLVVSANEA